MDTFGNWLRLSAKSLLSKTEKNSDIWANSDNLSPVKPLGWIEQGLTIFLAIQNIQMEDLMPNNFYIIANMRLRKMNL